MSVVGSLQIRVKKELKSELANIPKVSNNKYCSNESHSGTDCSVVFKTLAYFPLLDWLYSGYCELSAVASLSTLPTLKSGSFFWPQSTCQLPDKKAPAGKKDD